MVKAMISHDILGVPYSQTKPSNCCEAPPTHRHQPPVAAGRQGWRVPRRAPRS